MKKIKYNTKYKSSIKSINRNGNKVKHYFTVVKEIDNPKAISILHIRRLILVDKDDKLFKYYKVIKSFKNMNIVETCFAIRISTIFSALQSYIKSYINNNKNIIQ